MVRKFGLWIAGVIVGLAGAAQAEDQWRTLPDVPAMPEAEASGLAEVNGISMY